MRRTLPASGPFLFSACLAGRACAYDGSARPDDAILELVRQGRAVLVCPEEEGGLGTPRPAAEITGASGEDVLDDKARIAVQRANEHGCTTAVLKARSPACGCGAIYDGTFSKTLAQGDGVAAAAL